MASLKPKAGNFIPNPLVGYVNTLRRDMQLLGWEFDCVLPLTRRHPLEQDVIARKYFG